MTNSSRTENVPMLYRLRSLGTGIYPCMYLGWWDIPGVVTMYDAKGDMSMIELYSGDLVLLTGEKFSVNGNGRLFHQGIHSRGLLAVPADALVCFDHIDGSSE